MYIISTVMCGKFDDSIIVTGSSESLVEMWTTKSLMPVLAMEGHEAEIVSVLEVLGVGGCRGVRGSIGGVTGLVVLGG